MCWCYILDFPTSRNVRNKWVCLFVNRPPSLLFCYSSCQSKKIYVHTLTSVYMHIYKYFYVTIHICIKLNIYKHFMQPFMSVLRHKDVSNSNPLPRGLIYRLLLFIWSGVASHSNCEKSDYQYLPLLLLYFLYTNIGVSDITKSPKTQTLIVLHLSKCHHSLLNCIG